MANRYAKRPEVINDLERYSNVFKDRGVNFINMYTTPILKHLSVSDVRKLDVVSHRWTIGDKYFKLAHEYYGDSRYWWVIAWYNKKPTESHVGSGETVYIPTPLEDVLSLYEV